MKLKINGKEETISKVNSLVSLIEDKGFNPETIVVEHNLEVVPRDMWGEVSLSEGDTIEIVSFVGGG